MRNYAHKEEFHINKKWRDKQEISDAMMARRDDPVHIHTRQQDD